ncbi:DgyrCDS10546 [Dimorphilus gyrociliatus]|uniref:DgyrCDS10546 n=1 Tax=Dimorphilus gyrociliatus TaxID=2664684 RepID=A0A7I8W2I6_9ANNE|nr:DgyrCDS10546 [Dimorphilus gyrociliatus]
MGRSIKLLFIACTFLSIGQRFSSGAEWKKVQQDNRKNYQIRLSTDEIVYYVTGGIMIICFVLLIFKYAATHPQNFDNEMFPNCSIYVVSTGINGGTRVKRMRNLAELNY